MKALLLSLMGLCVAIPLHDYFISILTIRQHVEERTLDLTWQITAHDIEHALNDAVALKLGSEAEHPKADSILNAYLGDHLELAKDGKALHWDWVGKELEGEHLFCYLQISDVDDLGGISIANTLMQEVFAEQQNKVIIELPGSAIWTHVFNRGDGSVVCNQ